VGDSITASSRSEGLPEALESHNLIRRALGVIALLAAIGVAVAVAPGLGQVRHEIGAMDPAWLGVAVAFEALSCASYVLMFRPVFCPSMPWKLSWQISWSELGAGSIVPASGIGGLALGAWVLRQAGMPAERIARRSVAFFLIKGSVNFVLVALLGACMAIGLLGPHLSLWLTAAPAALSALTIAAVVVIGRLGRGPQPGSLDGRLRRWAAAVRNVVVNGAGEAVRIMRSGNVMVIAGAVGYYVWDNAVLWATFHAVGQPVPLTVVLMGYLIGQLGGLLPLPGGLGGIDGGLIGTLVVFGAPAAATATAVLAYRVILFWLPLVGGAIAFAALRRELAQLNAVEVCREAVRAA
jgi:uncharacterized protein (TIRG00374 family)